MDTPPPIPIEFALPDGWRLPEPAETSGGTVVAVHPSGGSIAVSGQFRPDNAQLVDMADEAVARLRETGATVEVLSRNEVGTAGSPGFTQVLRLVGQDVVQCQVLLALLDVGDDRRRVVLRIVMTTGKDQVTVLVGDFQRFLASVKPTGLGGTDGTAEDRRGGAQGGP
ncbi:hypothetical protein [Actinokineospora sp. UTMC 2448]|uniref:hypothetical protein n=1 Tax=Actinokineospora sp. UTMC 2448 TaxID=2268449 RepID=UPI002164DC49|nr:hypothetical protein [Actinokineospora sp. UTMC 2448]UVS79629.1 hypothetical protein Actkin_03379 [Actinokineospora sp. UTMC 2448]